MKQNLSRIQANKAIRLALKSNIKRLSVYQLCAFVIVRYLDEHDGPIWKETFWSYVVTPQPEKKVIG